MLDISRVCRDLLYNYRVTDFAIHNPTAGVTEVSSDVNPNSTATHCLRLPGKYLNLTALLYAKKFRFHGYKQGALSAFKELEEAQLGILETTRANGYVLIIGTYISKIGCTHGVYLYLCPRVNVSINVTDQYSQNQIPVDADEKKKFAKKLMQYHVSLLEYSKTLQQDEIQYVQYIALNDSTHLYTCRSPKSQKKIGKKQTY